MGWKPSLNIVMKHTLQGCMKCVPWMTMSSRQCKHVYVNETCLCELVRVITIKTIPQPFGSIDCFQWIVFKMFATWFLRDLRKIHEICEQFMYVKMWYFTVHNSHLDINYDLWQNNIIIFIKTLISILHFIQVYDWISTSCSSPLQHIIQPQQIPRRHFLQSYTDHLVSWPIRQRPIFLCCGEFSWSKFQYADTSQCLMWVQLYLYKIVHKKCP